MKDAIANAWMTSTALIPARVRNQVEARQPRRRRHDVDTITLSQMPRAHVLVALRSRLYLQDYFRSPTSVSEGPKILSCFRFQFRRIRAISSELIVSKISSSWLLCLSSSINASSKDSLRAQLLASGKPHVYNTGLLAV
eukprot:GHVU01133242.1.p1 GENE.GHVU01133242.1~~GHVU01133242.1.p1  ORF type:complete len:139 (-),score=1.18 GHVU01133242.1:76-492(-)